MSEETTLANSEAFLPAKSVGERSFELMQREARMLSMNEMVPLRFQGKIPECAIAVDMAHRLNANPLAVCQSLNIIHGNPSWSSQFVISIINSCGKFSPLRYKFTGEEGSRNRTCVAYANELETGERIYGPAVSIAMAVAEGWVDKKGSKWKTMPELMLCYRAATFFGRLYLPELMMGMKTIDEVEDLNGANHNSKATADKLNEDLLNIKTVTVEAEPSAVEEPSTEPTSTNDEECF